MSLSQPLPPSSCYGGENKREPIPFMQIPQSIPEDVWQQYLLRFDQDEGCGFQECDVEDTEHFHCKDEGCETVFRSSDEGVRDHGRNHFVQDNVTEGFFAKRDPEEAEVPPECSDACPHKKTAVHYHCKRVSL